MASYFLTKHLSYSGNTGNMGPMQILNTRAACPSPFSQFYHFFCLWTIEYTSYFYVTVPKVFRLNKTNSSSLHIQQVVSIHLTHVYDSILISMFVMLNRLWQTRQHIRSPSTNSIFKESVNSTIDYHITKQLSSTETTGSFYHHA